MPRMLLFCDLDLQFQGHWWPLQGQILAIFFTFCPSSHLQKVRSSYGWYIQYIYMCSVSMQKFDLEALHWRSSTDCRSTSLRPFLAFLEIFQYLIMTIAWKLSKMGVPASSLLTLAIVFKVTLGLLKWLKMVPFTAYICLYKTVTPYTSFIIGCITYCLMLIISRWPAGQEIMYGIGL